MTIPSHINMVPIEGSSNISRIGHDADAERLYVDFGKDKPSVYSYDGVPVHIAQQFHEAPSKGRFLASHIKGRYAHQKVDA